MKISDNGIKQLQLLEDSKGPALEAFAATQYEASKNIYTIAYGNTVYADGKKVKKGDKLTKLEAEKLFSDIVSQFESKLVPMLTMHLTQYQYDAIVSFAYNIGIDAFANSSMLRYLHQGNYNKAANEFTHWIYQNGKKLEGLLNRRIAERNLFYQIEDKKDSA